ncbi:MAG TPA: hypothetical protein GXZ32_03060 [Clostridiales bacterium]|nr:hypothetical protein [Clostridiales bacterium]
MPVLKRREKNNAAKRLQRTKWALKITILTFLISVLLSLFSETTLKQSNILSALLILFFIITIGIVFDIIGVAVTASSEIPFLSMASRKIPGAKQSLALIKNAHLVSSICNDVVGDICGIISGAAGAVISIRIITDNLSIDSALIGILISSIIASATVGGKAFSKSFAMNNKTAIVHKVGYIIYLLGNVFRGKLKRK